MAGYGVRAKRAGPLAHRNAPRRRCKDLGRRAPSGGALQDFENRGNLHIAEMSDPDRTIDHDHLAEIIDPTFPHRVEVAFPAETREIGQGRLSAMLEEEDAQRFLDGRPLGRQARLAMASATSSSSSSMLVRTPASMCIE